MDLITLSLARAELQKLIDDGGVGRATKYNLLPLTTINATYDEALGYEVQEFQLEELNFPVDPKAGDVWYASGTSIPNGRKSCTVKEKITDTHWYLYIGGGHYFGLELETELSDSFFFGVVIALDGSGAVAKLVDCVSGNTFGVEAETIHPIDPKFLPGVCLPVVEITSAEYPTEGGIVALSAEENAALLKAAELGLPICVKTSLGGPPTCVVVNAMFLDGTVSCSGYFAGLNMMFVATADGGMMGEE